MLMQRSFWLLLLPFLMACSSTPVVSPPKVKISLYSDETINEGQPFYLMVQKTTSQDFLLDNYDQVAARVFATPKNPAMVDSRIIFPGQKQTFEVLEPSKDALGLYFMFTKPADPWKIMLSKPYQKTEIQLLDDHIQEYDSSFLQRVREFSISLLKRAWSLVTVFA